MVNIKARPEEPGSPRMHFSWQNVIAEHEIRNISCAAQDPEDLCTFAYITKDLQTSHHYCHVFSTVDVVSVPVMVAGSSWKGSSGPAMSIAVRFTAMSGSPDGSTLGLGVTWFPSYKFPGSTHCSQLPRLLVAIHSGLSSPCPFSQQEVSSVQLSGASSTHKL